MTKDHSTRLGAFSSQKGVLILKEVHHIGSVKMENLFPDFAGLLGRDTGMLDRIHQEIAEEAIDLISVDSIILGTLSSTHSERVFGLLLSTGYGDQRISCLMDYDEISDLSHALEYFQGKHVDISRSATDYTELAYKSSDGFAVGFVVRPKSGQDGTHCIAYASINESPSVEFEPKQFGYLGQLCLQGRDYLRDRGAGS